VQVSVWQLWFSKRKSVPVMFEPPCTCQKLDIHVQFCTATLFKNSSANVGIKLYNKLPNTIKKVEKVWELKKESSSFTATRFLFGG
jgi:hypothetical protein